MDEKVTLAPMIKGIMPGLPEIGKIKIGMKGAVRTSKGGKDFQLPQRLDHFIVTTLERGDDGNFLRDEAIHQNLGQKPTSIAVSLLYDDPTLNFSCRWACFTGTQLWCTGDGENAYRRQKDGSQLLRACPCERNQPDFDDDQYRCKPSGVLSVILNDMQVVGGVYKFRTTSYNSVINLMSSLALIQRITGGVLAGIPLFMTVRPKTVIIPKTQKAMVVHIVGLEYRGSIQQLAQVGYNAALENATHRARIDDIEAIARKAIEPSLMLTEGESEADIAKEFYPESANDEFLDDLDATDWKDGNYSGGAPEDFDSEFQNEIQEDEWAEFWQRAVDFHAEKDISEDQLKVDIVSGGAGDFRVAFNKFLISKRRAQRAKEKVADIVEQKEPAEKKENLLTKPIADPDQAFIDEWWNLKSAGFSTYVFKNLERFKSCSNEARGKAKLKWVKLYPEVAWPGNKVALNDNAQPENEESKAVESDFVSEEDEFNELVMSDVWQEMSLLKEKFPGDYARITAGQTPKTFKRAKYVLSELEKCEDSDGGQGAGDDIPS